MSRQMAVRLSEIAEKESGEKTVGYYTWRTEKPPFRPRPELAWLEQNLFRYGTKTMYTGEATGQYRPFSRPPIHRVRSVISFMRSSGWYRRERPLSGDRGHHRGSSRIRKRNHASVYPESDPAFYG